MATTKLVSDDDLKPNTAYEQTMKRDREQQMALKGWKNAEVDYGDSFGQAMTTQAMNKKTHDPAERISPTKMAAGSAFEQRATVKRE